MKDIEKVVIPVILILGVMVLTCFYISKEYKKQQSEKRAKEIEAVIEENEEENGPVSKDDLSYSCVAILVGKNEEEGTLTFMSTENNKVFKAKFDRTTPFYGKHGNSVSLAQLSLGELLDITYSLHSGTLSEAKISENAWTFTDVTRFEIDESKKLMVIGDEKYKLPKNTIVSYGDKLAEMIDITNVDTLIVKGIDRKVCSIIVDRGHGYIRLLNDSYFVGGWIEIGDDIVKTVSEDMLLPVPEGEYRVTLSNKGYAGEVEVEVNRDKETPIDLSEIEIKEVAIGHVMFNIFPEYAQLYVDSQMTEFEERVPLEYGIHKVHVELAGYESVDTNVKISSEYADVSISLEKSGDSSSSSSSSSAKKTTSSSSTSYYLGSVSSSSSRSSGSSAAYASSSSSSTSSSSTSYYPYFSSTAQVDWTSSSSSSSSESSSSSSSSSAVVVDGSDKLYIEFPVGAEVYVDGVYIGISPVSSNKPSAGAHVITLSKNGYMTKSYTVVSYDDNRDMTLSFSELIEQ